MAKCDYMCCDICDSKVYYDSNVDYGYNDTWGVGEIVVLCKDCAKTHSIEIKAKPADAMINYEQSEKS